MLRTGDKEKPRALVIGRNAVQHYGETCFECFVNGAKALEKLKAQADDKSFDAEGQFDD